MAKQALRGPRRYPKDLAEFDRWAREATVTPSDATVGADEIVDGAVTDAKLRQSVAQSVIGRAQASEGAPADIVIGNGKFLVGRSSTLVADVLVDADIPASLARTAAVTAAISAALAPYTTILGMLHTGTGTPEGAVTAPVGHLYLRSDGGAVTSFYVKESGSSSTGWVAK